MLDEILCHVPAGLITSHEALKSEKILPLASDGSSFSGEMETLKRPVGLQFFQSSVAMKEFIFST